MTADTLRTYWLRHLRPIVPTSYIYGSNEDVPVNTTGPQSLKALDAIAKALPDEFHSVSSPSPRAQSTHNQILIRKGRPEGDYETDDRFHEQSWGRWEGRYKNDIPQAENQYYMADPDNRAPPGGDSLNQLLVRHAEGMDNLVARYQKKEIAQPHILITAHGGSVRAAMAHAEGRAVSEYLSQSVRRLALTIIDYHLENKKWEIVSRNLTVNPI